MTLTERPAEAAPVGANFFAVASPLWAYYGAAVATGIAVWSMTRMARTVNLEAFLGSPTLAAVPDLLASPAALPQPVLEAETAPMLEVAQEPVTPEPVTPEPVAEVVELAPLSPVEARVAADPVIEGEAVVEAAAEPTSEPAVAAPEPVLIADAAAEVVKAPVVRKPAASNPRSIPVES